MAFWSAIPIIGKVLDGVIGIVDQAVEDKDEANKIKSQLTEIFNKADLTKFSEQLKAQADIIVAETKSESWMARNWRPVIMLLFGVIIANNYILYPWLNELFELKVIMEIPPQMWSLLKLGLSGYVVGRSGEKMVKLWKEKDK